MRFTHIYCDVPGSPCLSKTGPVVGPYFSIFNDLSLGGLLETPPRWHVTIYLLLAICPVNVKKYEFFGIRDLSYFIFSLLDLIFH